MSGDSSLMLMLRLGFSLAFVLGLIWCAAWVVRRRNGQGGAGPIKLGRREREQKSPGIEILERRSVGRHGAVAVVRVGSRCLLVGITEQQVQLLGEIDSDAEVTAASNTSATVVLTQEADVDLTDDLTDDIDDAVRPAETIQTVARWTGPRGTESRSPRMNLVDAMRELTVRRT